MRQVFVWVLLGGMACAQAPGWQLPEPDCKVTPWLDTCPGHDKFKIDASKLNLNPTINVAPGKPRTEPPAASRATASTVDWKRPALSRSLPPDWPRWKFAPPDARMILGMKLKPLLASPLFKDLFAGAGAETLQAATAPVDEVWIAMRNNAQRRPEAVLLLLGPDLETVGADLRSKGVTVCFVDRHAMLAGEWSAVDRALARVLAPASAASGVDRRARELWVNDDVWFIADRSLVSAMTGAAHSALPGDVTRLSLGINLGEKLTFDVLLHTSDAAGAARVAARFKDQPVLPGLPEGVGAAQLEKLPGGVRAHATLDLTQMPDGVRAQMREQFQPVMDMIRNSSRRPVANAVVIEGLDNGPRVIAPKQ